MKIRIQLFGGRGSSSGGNFRGSSKTPNINIPNSTYSWYKNGKIYQKRWYDRFGKPKKDKDYTDHGNNKRHPVTPHYHDYENGQHGRGYWYDKNGEKHYFE